MSTIHKAGVTIAGLAATLTIAGAFVAQGYVAARQNAPRSTATVQTTAAPTDPAQQTETIYVNPVPSASVVHVVQTAPPLANPPVIHQVVAGGGEPRDDGPGSAGQGDN